jgi:hypothetical protein
MMSFWLSAQPSRWMVTPTRLSSALIQYVHRGNLRVREVESSIRILKTRILRHATLFKLICNSKLQMFKNELWALMKISNVAVTTVKGRTTYFIVSLYVLIH